MLQTSLNDVNAFLAAARERSFTKAAAKLGLSQSALSHTIRGLEERVGLRLLARTTRSVAPTEAGERLLRTVGPHLDEVDAELAALSELRDSGLYAWEFAKGGRELKVRVEGQLVFNNISPRMNAVLAGIGLAYLPEDQVQTHLAAGRQIRVLAYWCPFFPGERDLGF
jgi:DNA-binding transcriptional LysR family regulator